MSSNSPSMPRLALAHFGDAWLTRRFLHRDEFRHPARVLDEVVERGFNAVAIDPFPHLVAPRSDGIVIDRFELTGEHEVEVMPRRALAEFAKLAAQRDLKLWLSSRFLPDTQARRSFVRRPRDFIDVWSHTLEWLRHNQLLDTVVGVDVCQHFPLPPANHGAAQAIFRGHPLNRLSSLPGWSNAVEERVQHYLHEVPRALKSVFPGILFGISVSGATDRHIRRLDTSELDFLDRHFWLDEDPRFALVTGMPTRELMEGSAIAGLAGAVQGRLSGLAWRASRHQWQRHQERQLSQFNDFCRVRRLEPVLGRGYVHVPPHWHRDQRFLQEVSGFMVRSALALDVPVITPGYLARPQNPECWQQDAWLRDINDTILGTESRQASESV